MCNYFFTVSNIYTMEKTGMVKNFCNSFGTDIGADTISQTRSSEGASE